jgi:hypothetical protein
MSTCPCCGGRACEGCGRAIAPNTRGELCRSCYLRPQPGGRDWERIVELRQQGLLNIEIAERLDRTTESVGSAIWKMRKRGIAVPDSAYLTARREQNDRGYGPAHVRARTKFQSVTHPVTHATPEPDETPAHRIGGL